MRKIGAQALLTTLAVASCAFSAADPASRPAGKLAVKETPVCKLGAAGEARSLSISPDGNHVAVLTQKGTLQAPKFVVAIDGRVGKDHDWIVANSLTFTSDSAKCLYIVQQNNKMFVVENDKPGKEYHEIVNSDLLLSRAGGRYAYYAKNAGAKSAFVVIDGVEGKEYDQVGNLNFSPDGKRVAYGVERTTDKGTRQFFIIDDKPTREYEKVLGASFTFSPDSKHYAFGTVKDNKIVVVVDDREEAPTDEASRPVFSPDGQHVAYAARRDKKMVLSMDGKESKPYDAIAGDTIRFSPDSKRMAFMATRIEKNKDKDGKDTTTEKLFYVLDGEEMRPYEGLVRGSFIFSPDSKRTAYVGIVGVSERKPRFVVVTDGLAGGEYEDVRLLQFSPDSRKVAYLAKKEGAAYAIIDGAPSHKYLSVANLLFSADGKRLAYVAGYDTSMFVMLDSAEGRNYQGIVPETVAFSPNGRHLAYEAKTDEKPVIVVDGDETKAYDGSLRGSRLFWDSDNALRALVVKGGKEGEVVKLQVDVP